MPQYERGAGDCEQECDGEDAARQEGRGHHRGNKAHCKASHRLGLPFDRRTFYTTRARTVPSRLSRMTTTEAALFV
jgi:hypothetical protein